jgi:hypothetical protein
MLLLYSLWLGTWRGAINAKNGMEPTPDSVRYAPAPRRRSCLALDGSVTPGPNTLSVVDMANGSVHLDDRH